ncbi:unnamed protein product [Soboliphyme baturini]|uniref:MBF1 domain-containing protein n=1 Tax=Soboliphyme baturini TaxID=241478 RepID=A0A183I9T0_9BILA|nr:unnamed protein product [Soboliphyme baturini]
MIIRVPSKAAGRNAGSAAHGRNIELGAKTEGNPTTLSAKGQQEAITTVTGHVNACCISQNAARRMNGVKPDCGRAGW